MKMEISVKFTSKNVYIIIKKNRDNMMGRKKR